MKTLFTIVLTIGLLFGAAAVRAQSVTPKTYPLTNSIFSIANGATNIAGSGSITLNSPAVPLWRGRGFALHSSIWGTNAGTDNVTFTFQEATPYYSAGAWRTNWSTAGTATATVAQNGTTQVFGYNLIPPTTFDNAALVRISTVANAHASTIWLDPTNTFISVIP